MNNSDFNKEQLLQLISAVLDGGLEDADRATLNTLLKDHPEARRIYRGHMQLHTRLHLDYAAVEVVPHMPATQKPPMQPRFSARWQIAAALAACLAILAAIVWPRSQASGHFATVENVHGSLWGSGDLPTASGSRMGRGTLRLAEGMAKIRFDSGAELTIEAPAELRLDDAMHCVLSKGTAVAHVPESAIGFRIATPSAEIVDYGTRFSVVVDSATGSTQTQVYEGLIEVKEHSSGKVVSLRAGQTSATTESPTTGAAKIIGPPSRGPEWTLLESTKDAYIGQAYADSATSGRVEIHRSDTLLLLKNGTVHRKSYLAYDLAHLDASRITDAELTLH